MKTKILLVAAALALTACSDGPSAVRTLARQGYTNITTTGYSFFGCDMGKNSGDTFSTGFEATAPNGEHVSGVVCKGFLKGSTVRLND